MKTPVPVWYKESLLDRKRDLKAVCCLNCEHWTGVGEAMGCGLVKELIPAEVYCKGCECFTLSTRDRLAILKIDNELTGLENKK